MECYSSFLLEFEQYLKEGKTLAQFIADHQPVDSSALFELIGIDVEQRFRFGKTIDLNHYLDLVTPSNKEKLNNVFAESIQNFVETYCPVSDFVGPLPVKFGSYRILSEVARGGSGVVYKAEDMRLRRQVAIKVLFRNFGPVENEARVISGFEHPNICSVYDVGEVSGLTYVVMQFIDSPSLRKYCASPPPLSCRQSVETISKVLDSVAECHIRGVIHLDLKPGNILMRDNEPIIIDFGLAQSVGADSNVCMLLGSPDYMAPELLAGKSKSPRVLCDVYSVGVTLYELLTGKRPDTPAGRLDSDTPPRRPSDFRPEIESELDKICLKAISKNPFDRYASAREFNRELESWLSRESESLAEPDGKVVSFTVSRKALNSWRNWMSSRKLRV